jgi:hypothetical protein
MTGTSPVMTERAAENPAEGLILTQLAQFGGCGIGKSGR